MHFNNNAYEAIGVKIAEELFKEAVAVFPVSDEPTKPSFFKRLVGWVKQDDDCREEVPCGDEIPAHSSL